MTFNGLSVPRDVDQFYFVVKENLISDEYVNGEDENLNADRPSSSLDYNSKNPNPKVYENQHNFN